MRRAHNHAREPSGVEEPLLLVEVPAARLLRHQPSLQTIRKPRDDVLEARHLLVQIGAQAPKLLFVAEFRGRDRLVEPRRESLVVGLGRQVPVAAARRSEDAVAEVVARGRLFLADLHVLG